MVVIKGPLRIYHEHLQPVASSRNADVKNMGFKPADLKNMAFSHELEWQVTKIMAVICQ